MEAAHTSIMQELNEAVDYANGTRLALSFTRSKYLPEFSYSASIVHSSKADEGMVAKIRAGLRRAAER